MNGIRDERPQGVLGGSMWDEPERWRALADGSACPICVRGEPLGVLAERSAAWIASGDRVLTRGYLCVVSKRHVVELWQLEPAERAAFFDDVAFAAERVAKLLGPIKVNIELHGNSLPHLHAHVYPRFRGDRFVGGPIDNRLPPVEQSEEDMAALREALA